MGVVMMDEAAKQRQRRSASRPACFRCGLLEDATIHGSDVWWQHAYVPGILTRAG